MWQFDGRGGSPSTMLNRIPRLHSGSTEYSTTLAEICNVMSVSQGFLSCRSILERIIFHIFYFSYQTRPQCGPETAGGVFCGKSKWYKRAFKNILFVLLGLSFYLLLTSCHCFPYPNNHMAIVREGIWESISFIKKLLPFGKSSRPPQGSREERHSMCPWC